ncbi:GDSL esterase/lipase At5g03610-like [Juglans microcarpa x Juglans regia]|uniref:GDSL esterase/lipase At5g03610-like n=1 Tax=Juglans microcarpa x Juglans regia TaxID=2249226 RepID=UPI001B7E4AC8|nr:GDSL esterase/lipase At5g03610-like [Juglans microcarpa x Juglans regia]
MTLGLRYLFHQLHLHLYLFVAHVLLLLILAIMDAQQKLFYSVLCYFLVLIFLSGQQVLVQGHLTSDFRPSKLFVFGDSYADTGNTNKSESAWKHPYGITFPGKPYGRFSDGRVLTDYVAKFIGVKSPIQYRWRKYGTPLLRYGMNFAYGGTGAFDTVVYPGPNMTTQIDFFQHLIKKKVFTARDLKSSVCLVSLVGNDYFTYIARNGSAQGWQSFIIALINQLAVNLKRIHGLGVQKIAVTGLQPLGCLPARTANSSFRKCNATENSLVSFHNLLLQQAVAKLNNETSTGRSFVILDLYDSFMSVLENKGSIKFENPLKPCCFGISSEYSCGSVDANGAKKYTVCENPEAAFFWDANHPTQQGWRALFPALQATLKQLYY